MGQINAVERTENNSDQETAFLDSSVSAVGELLEAVVGAGVGFGGMGVNSDWCPLGETDGWEGYWGWGFVVNAITRLSKSAVHRMVFGHY